MATKTESGSGDEGGPSKSSAPPSSGWKSTRSGKRILELQQVEQSIGQLLHLAGCTLASLHPDPLESFTDDPPESTTLPNPSKEDQFADYAEQYYTTLNDIQLSLRTSIRHLRLSRASSAPLIDPHFGTLSNPGGGSVGVGGFAMVSEKVGEAKGGEAEVGLSVQAMEIEMGAWRDLEKALKGGGVEEKGAGEEEDRKE